jgi:hypothetical protein
MVQMIGDQDLIVSASGYYDTLRSGKLDIREKGTGHPLRTIWTEEIKHISLAKDNIILAFTKKIASLNIEQHRKFADFLKNIPLIYIPLLQVINSAIICNRKVDLTVDQKELLAHFLETIKENWGERVGQVIQSELQKLQPSSTCALV